MGIFVNTIKSYMDKIQLRKAVFDNYAYFIKYAKEKFPSSHRRGILHEELVNESVINIFDCRADFNSESDVIAFIEMSIRSTQRHEAENLRDANFILQVSGGEEYSKLDKGVFLDRPSDEFIEIYNIFEGLRFGEQNEKKVCPKCQCVNFYNIRTGLKCKACSYKMSLTSSTYISNMKLKYSVFYKLVTTLCEQPEISTHSLAKKLKITQVTAWKRKRLIVSVMENMTELTCSSLMSRILTSTRFDKVDFKLQETNKHRRSYTDDEIREMRRLKDILKAKEIADIYQCDISNLYKIFNRKVYNHVN